MSKQPGWQLAGSAPELYEQYLVPSIFKPWAHLLTEHASLQPGERVLDVACGTGVVARLAAQQVQPSGKVIGIDINPGMLAVARTVPTASDVTIAWREADACTLPFENAAFDAVFCQLGLMYFPDRVKALEEMYRVLASHGRLILLVWRSISHSPGFAAIAEALERHVSPEAGALMRAPFIFEDRPEELQELLASAQFTNIRIHADVRMVRFASPADLVQYSVAASPLATHIAESDDAARTALIHDVSTALQSYVSDSEVAFPIEGYIAMARP